MYTDCRKRVTRSSAACFVIFALGAQAARKVDTSAFDDLHLGIVSVLVQVFVKPMAPH